MSIIIIVGLFILALISGILGLGVAFAVALFMEDLVHQVQPISLLVNGITALFVAFVGVLTVIMTLYKIYTMVPQVQE